MSDDERHVEHDGFGGGGDRLPILPTVDCRSEEVFAVCGRLLWSVFAVELDVLECSAPKESAPKGEAPAVAKNVLDAKHDAPKANLSPTPSAPPKSCSEDEAWTGGKFLHSPATSPDMLTVHSLQIASMACRKHRGMVARVKHLANARLDGEAKRRADAEGIWQTMGLV